MGTKGHGTYAKLFKDVWRHAKTFRLAASIAKLGYPERAAKREAVGQFHELLCWCVDESDDGQVGHLPAAEFARIVGWDDPRKAPQLLAAWLNSGFLDVYGDGDVRVHDFTDAAKDLLLKRAKRRPSDGGPSGNDDEQRCTDGAPPVHQRPPNGAPTAHPRARAGYGYGYGLQPSVVLADPEPPPAEPSSPPVGDAPSKPEAPPVEPKPPKPPKAKGPPAPTVTLCEAWRASGQDAGYPAVAVNGQTAKTLADAWRAAGADDAATARVESAVAAFFADRSDFVVRQGHSIGEFGRTSAKWLAIAAGTAPRASSRAEIAVGGATSMLFGGGS